MSTSDQLSLLNGILADLEGRSCDALIREMRSSTPTRHCVTIASGLSFHVHCTLDALLSPFLLDEDVEVESIPPTHSASPLRFQIVRGRLTGAPEGLVVAIPLLRRGVLQESFCPYSNLFPNQNAYLDWACSVDVPTQALPLSEALDLARNLAAQFKHPGFHHSNGAAGRCC